MSLIISKVYIFLLLIVCRLVSGLCPLLISRKFKRKHGFRNVNKKWVERAVAYSMDFSGGILLATCFIHMIPEVREHLVETLKSRYVFPFTETLVCIGFFMIYVIEELVNHMAEGKSSHKHEKKPGALMSTKSHHASFEAAKNEREPIELDEVGNGMMMTSTNNGQAVDFNSMIKDDVNECNNNTNHLGAHDWKNFLLISALSFHSVMEGLAIGLGSDMEDVWYLFLAVTVHECTILLCVGIELVATCSRAATVITYMAVLALVSPAGVLVGTLITLNLSETDPSTSQQICIGSLQGLAAGTILYVTFFEVLNNHKHHHHHHGEKHHQSSDSGLAKLVFIALGFIFMIVLELASGHENFAPSCDGHHEHSGNKSS